MHVDPAGSRVPAAGAHLLSAVQAVRVAEVGALSVHCWGATLASPLYHAAQSQKK